MAFYTLPIRVLIQVNSIPDSIQRDNADSAPFTLEDDCCARHFSATATINKDKTTFSAAGLADFH